MTNTSTAGSAGATDLLAADTSMGAVTLLVADLDLMTAYYRDAVTLTLLAQGQGRSVLGRGATPIVILEHAPALQHAGPREAGLFHTAILFPTQSDLADAVYAVASRHPGSFTGSADHLVSQAFYFNDPEGNGVELYWDRDRTAWSWTHGRVEMDTLMLDPNAFLREFKSPEPRDTTGPPLSGTCISVSETWPPPATSTLIGSDSRPPRSWVLRRCLSVPAAITITWR